MSIRIVWGEYYQWASTGQGEIFLNSSTGALAAELYRMFGSSRPITPTTFEWLCQDERSRIEVYSGYEKQWVLNVLGHKFESRVIVRPS